MNKYTKYHCAFLLMMALVSCANPEAENWRRRWDEDRKLFTDEIRDLTSKSATLKEENTQLRNRILILEKQLKDAEAVK